MLFIGFSSTEGGANLLLGRTIFNITYTGVPIILIATYDRDISQWMAIRYARLYRAGPNGEHFNGVVLAKWMIFALVQSILIVIICIYVTPMGGTFIDMGLAEFGWYGMFFTCFVANIHLMHTIQMWFWWCVVFLFFFISSFLHVFSMCAVMCSFMFNFVPDFFSFFSSLPSPLIFFFFRISIGMIFFSLFCFPMIYIVLGHWVGMVQTEDAPFPSAAFSNPNFYVSLLVLFGFIILPELLLNSFARRFRTTFHLLAQEVEQLSWFQKQSQEAGDDYSLQPIHKELDNLDKILW